MKILKAQTSHPKKTILKISDLDYIKYYEQHNAKLTFGVEDIKDIMINPIEVQKHTISPTVRYGANGAVYKEKLYTILKGNQRVTQAKRLGYTHIEAIVNE
jgi:hypothetical protein